MSDFRRRLLVACVGLAISIVILSGAALLGMTERVPTPGGIYTEAVLGLPRYINPILSHPNEVDEDLVFLVFSGLTRQQPNGDIVPDLALDWEISADGTEYTFYLRSDVRWHDGHPFSADDVVFTINALKDPDYPGSPAVGELWREVNVAKIDAHTVRLSLQQPFAPFLEYTSLRPLPSHVLGEVPLQEMPDLKFNALPIGTGPFRVIEANLEQVTLDRYRGYHGPLPFLSRVQLRFFSSAAGALAALEAGQVQGLSGISPQLISATVPMDRVNLYSEPEVSKLTLLILNTRSPVFSEKSVRQAVAYAIDRDRIVSAVYEGQAIVAPGPISPTSWAYDSQTYRGAYRPALARDLLDRSGWQEVDEEGVRVRSGQRLEFVLLTNNHPERIRLAEELRQQLSLVGIKADVQTVSWIGLLEDFLVPGRFDAVLAADWNPSSDPDPYAFWHSTQIEAGLNFAGWSDPRADVLLERARQQLDPKVRQQLYRDFQMLFAEEAPSIPLVHPLYIYAVGREIRGVRIGPILRPRDRFAAIEEWHIRLRRAPRRL